MESTGRVAFREMVDARITEWQKNITTLEQKLSKKDDADAREKVALMKERIPALAEKSRTAMEVSERAWPDFKSETDLIFENLDWLQGYVQRRMGG